MNWLAEKSLFGLARGMWALIMAAAVCALAWWIIASMIGGASDRVEIKLAGNQTEAAIASGTDAVATIGAQGAAEDAVDAITRENERAIRNAQGADVPVPPAVATAGRISLCKRAAYRGDPKCVQFTPASGMEEGSARRAAP